MTQVLRRVLHDVAAAAVLEPPDVERIVTLGRIRAHRRLGAAGLALALVVAATVAVLQEDDESEPPAADAPDPGGSTEG